MDDTRQQGESNKKKTYAQPVLMRIPLRPEEAVLGFCKTASTGGPLQGVCTSPTVCSSPGS